MCAAPRTERCDECGNKVHKSDIIHLSSEGKSRPLCTRCYNEGLARMAGLDFQHPTFEPIEMTDFDGVSHRFRFRTILYGHLLSVQAMEEGPEYPCGYHIEVAGDPEEDAIVLFQDLYQRIQKELGRKHLVETEHGLSICDEDVVRGRVEWDDETDGQLPLLIIDGKPISWHQLGRMLMTYEGWQFKLQIFDRSEES